MRATLLALAVILGAAAPAKARAGETRCWYENGAVVVAAAAGDIAGDFILDLSAPRSLLHETRAQDAGIDAPQVTLKLRLAGERLGDIDFQVADLDARSDGFPTNIVGVIGADALAARVIDVDFAPCHVEVWPGRAPRLAAALRAPLRWVGGVPTVAALIADGASARPGRFALDTASAGVRISATEARLSRSPPNGVDPASRNRPPARLRALSFAGLLVQNLPASLDPGIPDGVGGGIGDAVWSRYRLRIDLGHGWLALRARTLPPEGGVAARTSSGTTRGVR